MAVNTLVPRIINSFISIYTPQCGFDDSQKDTFDSIFKAVRKLMEKEIILTTGDSQVEICRIF